MSLEVIRRVDGLGRICIPKDFRRSLGITEKTRLLFLITEDGIILKKTEDANDAKSVSGAGKA